MSTLSVADIPLSAESPAQRLRRTAAAVRVLLHWWGVHRALTPQQREEIGAAAAADARFLTAGKKLVDTRHEAFRRLTSIRTRITNYWRGISLPYVEAGVRLIPLPAPSPRAPERPAEAPGSARSEMKAVRSPWPAWVTATPRRSRKAPSCSRSQR